MHRHFLEAKVPQPTPPPPPPHFPAKLGFVVLWIWGIFFRKSTNSTQSKKIQNPKFAEKGQSLITKNLHQHYSVPLTIRLLRASSHKDFFLKRNQYFTSTKMLLMRKKSAGSLLKSGLSIFQFKHYKIFGFFLPLSCNIFSHVQLTANLF